MTKQNLKFLEFVFFFFVILLLFLLRFNSFTSPFERDEGEYAYSAWLMKTGDVPYRDSFLQKPPMIVYTYLLSDSLGFDQLSGPRILSFISLSGSILLIYWISKKEFGIKSAIAATLISIVMLSIPIITPFAANTENFLIFPLLGALAVFVYSKVNAKWYHWILFGGLSALSLLYKPIALFSLIFIYGYWQYELYLQQKSIGKVFIGLILTIIGGALITLLVFLPFIGNNFKYFWETAIVFNGLYASHWGFGLTNFFGWLGKFTNYWWIIIPVVIAFFGLGNKDKKLFWGGILATALMGVYQTPIGHYYILVMPFLSVIVGHGIFLISERFKQINMFLVTTLVIGVMLFPFIEQFSKTPEEINIWIYGTANPFIESTLVANKIRENSSEKDLIFVAGSEPQIYSYSKRKSPTRFVITYPFIIQTPLMEKYQKEAKEDLDSNKPKYIVYSNRQFSGLWEVGKPTIFVEYLNELIKREYSVSGAYLWNSKGGYWSSSPDISDLRTASLILYKINK